jgi:hypothetical protein
MPFEQIAPLILEQVHVSPFARDACPGKPYLRPDLMSAARWCVAASVREMSAPLCHEEPHFAA